MTPLDLDSRLTPLGKVVACVVTFLVFFLLTVGMCLLFA